MPVGKNIANVSFSTYFPPNPQYLAWKVATVTRGESVVNEGLQAGSQGRWPTLRTGDLGCREGRRAGT